MNMKNTSDMNSILVCSNIEKVYKNGCEKLHVITPSNFRIGKGTRNLILGKSGSGKTTLLNILAGLETPTGGQVFYQNHSFYDLSEKEQAFIRGTKYGFIFQSFNLIPELTVTDNIRVPLIINNGTQDEQFLNKIIKILGLKKRLHHYPAELSGGEQQRAAIARAMVMKPQILFADEPTGNLDEENSNKIMDLLDEIHEVFGTTIILVTHDLSLMKNPDQEFYIGSGKIICQTRQGR